MSRYKCSVCKTNHEYPDMIHVCVDCSEKLSKPKQEESELPWVRPELEGWVIVGMNHYHQEGRKYLFCSMVKDGRCITAEGLVEYWVFDRLAEQATAVADKEV